MGTGNAMSRCLPHIRERNPRRSQCGSRKPRTRSHGCLTRPRPTCRLSRQCGPLATPALGPTERKKPATSRYRAFCQPGGRPYQASGAGSALKNTATASGWSLNGLFAVSVPIGGRGGTAGWHRRRQRAPLVEELGDGDSSCTSEPPVRRAGTAPARRVTSPFEPPDAEPHVRWCGRGPAGITRGPYPDREPAHWRRGHRPTRPGSALRRRGSSGG